MKTIIKWPGGKSREIKYIKDLYPKYDRYLEPFFGGGAVFFDLMPEKALINDISTSLMTFFKLVKKQDEDFHRYLKEYDSMFKSILETAEKHYPELFDAYNEQHIEDLAKVTDKTLSESMTYDELVLDYNKYKKTIFDNVLDKMKRTYNNNLKKPFSDEDLKENLLTGFASGFYIYFRSVYNDIGTNKITKDDAYSTANFYYIREYCYGSMFRYNANNEFNIPYGGMSYNRKNFTQKIEDIFNEDIKKLFSGTEIHSTDFEEFLDNANLTENDFVFFDPPYDTDFSDYEGRDFDLQDQRRLCDYIKNMKAKFILIIKNTDFIYNLYKDSFTILSFDKNYTYNVRSRNNRKVEHLIITNISND